MIQFQGVTVRSTRFSSLVSRLEGSLQEVNPQAVVKNRWPFHKPSIGATPPASPGISGFRCVERVFTVDARERVAEIALTPPVALIGMTQ